MSSSIWGYLFLVLGVIAVALLLLFGQLNTKDEDNYYLLKENLEAAMLDSVDENAYKVGLTEDEVNAIKKSSSSSSSTDSINCVSGQPGTVRIIEEQFIENFTVRFADTASLNKDYKIYIYDIVECPPMVSIRIESTQNYSWAKSLMKGEGTDTETVVVQNLIGIIETKNNKINYKDILE